MPNADRRAEYLRRKARGRIRPALPSRECLVCGKAFVPWKDSQRRCSIACRTNAPLLCAHCGGPFRNRGGQKRRQQFCSKACKYESGIGRYYTTQGYVRVRVPRGAPGADKSGRMLEHRWVMQQALGRPLLPTETVHHINGDKQDNRLENLQLRTGRHGRGVRLACLDCGSANVGAVPV